MTDEQQRVLSGAYWKLREHASGYRSADVFRRAMEAYEADRTDPVKCRRAMNHEWYARGIEAAARTLSEMLGVPEHELSEPCSCGGRRWVDDQNWQPEPHERAAGRVPGAGLVPCGFCNEGGRDTPVGGQDTAP